MNVKYSKLARRSAIVVFVVVLMLTLLVAWSVLADDLAPTIHGALEQYEITLTDTTAGQLEVLLPADAEYVGLAPGSQVSSEPSIVEDGIRVVWTGPFPDAAVLRFWVALDGPEVAQAILPVTGAGVEALRVQPVFDYAVTQEGQPSSTQQAAAVSVIKTVDPTVLSRTDSRWVTYEVVFSNSGAEAVTLDRITDTLPADFIFGAPTLGDQVGVPVDDEEPDIVWENKTVPASGTLTMRYLVRAVNRAGAFENSVVALSGSQLIGPAKATLQIEGNLVFLPMVVRNYRAPGPEWNLTKTADQAVVADGDVVKYTVTIQNVGNLAGTLGKIVDQLPSDFTFVQMLSEGSITTPPTGTTGELVWNGPWTVNPAQSLTLVYKVSAGGGGIKVNTISAHLPGDTLVGSASCTVTVGGGLPYENDFSTAGVGGQPVDWQPLVNWPGLDADRWYVSGGYYIYDYQEVLPAYVGYEISMYRGSGSEGWTDYRIETRIKDSKTENQLRALSGVWFRGTYADSGLMDGKAVGGYYFFMKPGDDHLYLGRIRSGDKTFFSYDIVASYLYGPRIGNKHWYDVVIEVRGSNIQVWFGDEVAGMVQAFNYTDPLNAWPNGGVGLATYYTVAIYDYIKVLPLSP